MSAVKIAILLLIFTILIIILLQLGIRKYPYETANLCNPIINVFSKKKHSINDFDFLQEFIENIDKIRNEYIAASDVAYDVGKISRKERNLAGNDSKWKMLPVKILNNFTPESDKVPTVKRLVKKYSDKFSTVYYSILEPGKILPIHKGPYKGVIRCHIPLIIPKGDLGLKVYDAIEDRTVVYKWEKPFIFDDTEFHSAWNKTKSKRVILLMDLIRPLPFGIKQINNGILNIASSSKFL